MHYQHQRVFSSDAKQASEPQQFDETLMARCEIGDYQMTLYRHLKKLNNQLNELN
jgi:hypothetical protein